MALLKPMSCEELVAIPAGIGSLEQFREWTYSSSFPCSGRIDYLDHELAIDMSPEQFFDHGGPKAELARALGNIVRDAAMGVIRIDSTRIVSPEAGLSCEPDIVFVSYDSLRTGRVSLVPGRRSGPEKGIEIEGGPDLVVEVVSDSSVIKDRERLPKAYYAAGVREYWLVDARREELQFEIFTRGATAFRRVRTDAAGFCRSTVLARKFRLEQSRQVDGYPEFELVSE